ncbi:MAG TPA: C40 family peptidase [Mobilitalea sp.]|nr:C40 family peptidase [Mobilitalea sp.]
MKSEDIKSSKKQPDSSTVPMKSAEVPTNIRSELVAYALKFEGNPYVWGGTSLTKGTDCSGFTQSVFKDKGINIPRTSKMQASGGKEIAIDNMKPADLIFYGKDGTINHVAIYIGNGKVISASSKKTGIRITQYDYRQPYKAVSYIENI